MNKKLITAFAGLAVVASVAGCGLTQGKTTTTSPATVTTTAPAANSTSPSTSTPSTNASGISVDPQTTGMTAVSQKDVTNILDQKVTNANGNMVSIPTDKPILFVAPWCKYCHTALQQLQKAGLLDKVQIVAVAFDGAEQGQTPPVINGLSDAKKYLGDSFQKAGVTGVDLNKVLYDLPPQDAVGKNLQQFPATYAEYQGKWYVMPGLINQSGWWEQLLKPQTAPQGPQGAPNQPAQGNTTNTAGGSNA